MSRFGERRPQPTGPGVGRCGGTDQGAGASVAARPPASEAADSAAAPAAGVIGLAPSEARRSHPRYSNRPQRFSPQGDKSSCDGGCPASARPPARLLRARRPRPLLGAAPPKEAAAVPDGSHAARGAAALLQR
jgi:hypothetical protein